MGLVAYSTREVASARLFDATVLTVDQLILSYPHVSALW